MNSRKNHNKKLMLPVLIFLVGCLVLTVVLYHSYRSNYKQVRNVTALNAATYAERLQNDMNRGVAITDTLEEIAISENGKIDNFQKVARGDYFFHYISPLLLFLFSIANYFYFFKMLFSHFSFLYFTVV